MIEYKRGKKLSEETKAKIAKAHLKENMSPEYRQKLSEATRRRVVSEETKQKTGARMKQAIKDGKCDSFLYAGGRAVKGTITITNRLVIKRISKVGVSNYLESGWVLGNKLKIKVNNGKDKILVPAAELDSYLKSGWVRGWWMPTEEFIKHTKERTHNYYLKNRAKIIERTSNRQKELRKLKKLKKIENN